MRVHFQVSKPFATAFQVLRWGCICAAVGIVAGSASAAFLLALDLVTTFREAHPRIIWALPLAGLAVGFLYHAYGRNVERGNNLLLEEIHNPQRIIPARMTPFVFLGSVLTHLFGGSAGREGVALQMGSSLADQLTPALRLCPDDRRILLMAGMSAGFASIFGTPLSGAVFGLEVLAIGRLQYTAIFPCFAAALIGNQVTLAYGIHHTIYDVGTVPDVRLTHLLLASLAGAIFGFTGMAFARVTHAIGRCFERHVGYPPLRPFIGGALVAAAVFAFGTTKYIGLGVPTIVAAFKEPLPAFDFVWKFLFTAITLGAGFKGGEVTPLFFIGATLGNALSGFLPIAMPSMAAIGFVGVFAGAANTPLACTLLAIELFGGAIGPLAAIACVTSYLFSGHSGIYHAQRIGHSKFPRKDER